MATPRFEYYSPTVEFNKLVRFSSSGYGGYTIENRHRRCKRFLQQKTCFTFVFLYVFKKCYCVFNSFCNVILLLFLDHLSDKQSLVNQHFQTFIKALHNLNYAWVYLNNWWWLQLLKKCQHMDGGSHSESMFRTATSCRLEHRWRLSQPSRYLVNFWLQTHEEAKPACRAREYEM